MNTPRSTVLGFTATPDARPEEIAFSISEMTGALVQKLDSEQFGENVFGFRMLGRPVAFLCPALSARIRAYLGEDADMEDVDIPPIEPMPGEWFIVGEPGFVLGFAMHLPDAVDAGRLHADLAQAMIEELSEPGPDGKTLFAELSAGDLQHLESVLVRGLGRALADQVMTAFLHGRPDHGRGRKGQGQSGDELPPDILATLESLDEGGDVR